VYHLLFLCHIYITGRIKLSVPECYFTSWNSFG
jgi:hypothetical protein